MNDDASLLLDDKSKGCDAAFHFMSAFRYCPVCGGARFAVSGVRSRRCADCGFEFFCNASAAVAAFIVDGEGRLLVCRRAKNPARGTLDLPGGFVDPDESMEDAMARELEEELGCRPATIRYLFSGHNRYEYSGVVVPTADSFFLCTLPAEAVLRPQDDVAAYDWVPLADVHPSDFGLHSIAEGVARFLRMV